MSGVHQLTTHGEQTGFDDVLGDIRTALTGASQWLETQVGATGFILPHLQAGQNDYFQFKIQFPHRKVLGTAIASLHLHVIPSVANTGKVKYQYAYCWVNVGDAIPLIGNWAGTTIEVDVDAADVLKHKLHSIVTNITLPNETYSSILLIKVTRLSQGQGADTYTGNIGLLYMDAHITVGQFGSKFELSDTE
ncbi:MAG: hypothetical protein RLY43_219 [Bacteroidota bacterium]